MGAIDAGLLRRTASRGSHFFCKQRLLAIRHTRNAGHLPR